MQRIKYSSPQFLSFVLDNICLHLFKYDMILVEFPNIKFQRYQLIWENLHSNHWMRQFFKNEELFIEFITKIGAAGKLHGQRPSENFGGLKWPMFWFRSVFNVLIHESHSRNKSLEVKLFVDFKLTQNLN